MKATLTKHIAHIKLGKILKCEMPRVSKDMEQQGNIDTDGESVNWYNPLWKQGGATQ